MPDLSQEVFGKKMVLEQGVSKVETLSIQTLITEMFYITFAWINICKQFWDMVKAAGPESPVSRLIGNCPVQREEKRTIVSMWNPHIPGKDITSFLKWFCMVVRDPTHILNVNGFWTGKWSMIVCLHNDPTSHDGVQHLPQTFYLRNSLRLIFKSEMTHICQRCSWKGHWVKVCKEFACRICHVAGHKTKDCLRKTFEVRLIKWLS